MSTIAKVIADFTTRLSAKISAGATSAIIQSIVDSDGNNIPNGYYFFTLDGDNSLKEYIFCLLTSNTVSGVTTYDLTAINSVSVQGVKTSGTVREHRYGSKVEITNFGQIRLLNDIMRGADSFDGTNPVKYDATVTISGNKYIATKAYVDSKSIGTIAKASDSVLGKFKMSCAPVSAGSPIALGNNDPRIPTQDQRDAMVGTGTPNATNKYVTADNSARVGNVDLTTAQGVDDIKTFTSIPVLPASDPTTDNQMVRKSYADAFLYTA